MSSPSVQRDETPPFQYTTTSFTAASSTQETSSVFQMTRLTEGESFQPSIKEAKRVRQPDVVMESIADKGSPPPPSRAITPGKRGTLTTDEQSAIEAVVSQSHLFANVFSCLPHNDRARATLACHAFQHAGNITALQYIQNIKQLAAVFGIKGISFTIDDNTNIRLAPSESLQDIINAIKAINGSLPERLRSKNSIETLVHSPYWLWGFFQHAYECQLLAAFGDASGMDGQIPFHEQVCIIRTWCTTTFPFELQACGKGLLILPQEIEFLTDLDRLDISDNLIGALPPQIGQLAGLKGLFVANNRLTEVPPQLNLLTSLQVLDVSSNHLERFPSQIDQLVNLIELDVHQNNLKSLPEILFHLPRLHMIDARNNPDLRIPDTWIATFRARGDLFLQ